MKNSLLFVLTLLLSLAGYSQRPVQFGIKAGVNLANYNDAVFTSGSRTGFHAGLLAHIHLNRSWALQPELVYSTQGAQFNNGEHQVDYINIPVLFQYMFRSGFRLQTGPQVGILTSAKFDENDGDMDNIRSGFNSSDISWSFGLGYLTSSRLGVDARYNLGLTDITKGGVEVNNRVWQFGLFYQFRP